jgi:hypothetical protein
VGQKNPGSNFKQYFWSGSKEFRHKLQAFFLLNMLVIVKILLKFSTFCYISGFTGFLNLSLISFLLSYKLNAK